MSRKKMGGVEGALNKVDAVKNSYEICIEIGIANKLSKQIKRCLQIYEEARKKLFPQPIPIFTTYFFVIFASYLEKCDKKGLLHDLKIEDKLSKLKIKREEKCYLDLAHCITKMLELNGDVEAGPAVL